MQNMYWKQCTFSKKICILIFFVGFYKLFIDNIMFRWNERLLFALTYLQCVKKFDNHTQCKIKQQFTNQMSDQWIFLKCNFFYKRTVYFPKKKLHMYLSIRFVCETFVCSSSFDFKINFFLGVSKQVQQILFGKCSQLD